MQTVVELASFIAAAKTAGMSDEERELLVLTIAANPEVGKIMVGCGGARKMRFAKQGGGKSGGYRSVYYFGGDDMPIFALTVFGKNEKDNLSSGEKAQIAKACKALRDSYR